MKKLEPKKRFCAVCKKDISHLHVNRLYCSPTCIRIKNGANPIPNNASAKTPRVRM